MAAPEPPKVPPPVCTTVTGCMITAEAGRPAGEYTARAIEAVAAALKANAEALGVLSQSINTAPGHMGAGIHVTGGQS